MKKCVWCGNTISTSPLVIEFKEGLKNVPAQRVHVCHDACKKDLIETENRYAGKARWFIFSLVLFLLLAIISLMMFSRKNQWLYAGIAGMIQFGVTVYFLPFVTPQTVRLVGYKKGYIVGRVSGLVFVFAGIVLGLFLYFYLFS